MISRRKVFGWLSGLAAGGVGTAAAAHVANVDGPRAFFPLPFKEEPSAEFARYQKWFRDNPDMVWASQGTAQVVWRAGQLSEPFAAANPLIEYEVWADRITDNVLMKVRRLDRKVTGVDVGLGAAITRHAIEDDADLDTWLTSTWAALTAAVDVAFNRPIKQEGGATSFLPLRKSPCLS